MDTIVAVATAAGRSAIGVIRLSGPESLEIARALTHEPDFTPEPHRVLLKQILQESGELIDAALLSYFERPRSFTGEDVVEISCHGSPVILKQLLDRILRLGARLAEPGEFTLRACKNGKMNLSQAEAIRDLINARTEAAALQAARQLKGELSNALQVSKDELIQIIVRLESALEFVEDDLPQVQADEIRQKLGSALAGIEALVSSYATGHLLRDGIKLAIVGRPNVGKSSVFNRLVRVDRAIVTDVAGTTRDSITESVSLRGVPVSLTDTAGMRVAGDKIEQIGIERTHQAIAEADLLVVVIDGSVALTAEDRAVLAEADQRRYVVAINKCDLGTMADIETPMGGPLQVVYLSALTGEGLEDLSAAILEVFGDVDSEAVGFLVTDSRHYDLLRRAQDSLHESVEALSESASEELVLVGLHNALRFLGEITGETTAEEILGEIFSTFCVGK